MDATDPRHGTERGYAAHKRAGQTACNPCYQGRLRADRRRRKLRTLGRSRRQPIGPALYTELHTLTQTHSHAQIGRWAGVQPTVIHRIMRQGPTAVVDINNKLKLTTLIRTPEVTPTGYTRRMRALMALGYSAPQIAAEAGLNKETVKKCLQHVPVVVKMESRRKMSATYDRLSLTLPAGTDRFTRAQITRARETARRNGWAPPLAWDDIDDANEHPTDWAYTSTRRIDQLEELNSYQVNVSEVCRRLHLSRGALEKFCARANRSDLYAQFAAREASIAQHNNQYTAGRVA